MSDQFASSTIRITYAQYKSLATTFPSYVLGYVEAADSQSRRIYLGTSDLIYEALARNSDGTLPDYIATYPAAIDIGNLEDVLSFYHSQQIFAGSTSITLDESSIRTITGRYTFLPGTLQLPEGATFPSSPVNSTVHYVPDDEALYIYDTDSGTWVSLTGLKEVTPHAPTHIVGGTDVLDGDKIEIDFVPNNYTRDSSPPEVGSLEELTAHLKGIDDALTPLYFADLNTDANNSVDTVTNVYNPGSGANDGLFVRTTLNVTISTAGTFRLDYAYLWNHDATTNDFIGQIKQDGAVIYFHRQEPKDSSGGGPGFTNQVMPASGFELITLTPGTYNFVFSFGTSTAGVESTVLRSNFMFYRLT